MTEAELKKMLAQHKEWLDSSGRAGKQADFSGADLRGTNLSGLDLSGGADFYKANLKGVNFQETDLRWTCFTGADLTGADLRGAKLYRVCLAEARLKGAKIDYQIEPGLLQTVAKAALEYPDSLEMVTWHTCATTHCIAGWACHLAENGKELEKSHDPEIAGLLLLGHEAHSHFFDSNEDAKKYLQSVLEREDLK
ncbi:MAG TPA: pentapeptide repeat-containing protein [Vampirovibrionales bacterium]